MSDFLVFGSITLVGLYGKKVLTISPDDIFEIGGKFVLGSETETVWYYRRRVGTEKSLLV